MSEHTTCVIVKARTVNAVEGQQGRLVLQIPASAHRELGLMHGAELRVWADEEHTALRAALDKPGPKQRVWFMGRSAFLPVYEPWVRAGDRFVCTLKDDVLRYEALYRPDAKVKRKEVDA